MGHLDAHICSSLSGISWLLFVFEGTGINQYLLPKCSVTAVQRICYKRCD